LPLGGEKKRKKRGKGDPVSRVKGIKGKKGENRKGLSSCHLFLVQRLSGGRGKVGSIEGRGSRGGKRRVEMGRRDRKLPLLMMACGGLSERNKLYVGKKYEGRGDTKERECNSEKASKKSLNLNKGVHPKTRYESQPGNT